MRRLVLALLVLALAIPSADARRKKETAGAITNNLFQDSDYGYQFATKNGWKVRIGKKDDNARLVLIQEKHGVPPRYADVPDYTYIPRIVVYADTSSLGVGPFTDSLLSQTFKSDQKKGMLKEFEFLALREVVPKSRKFLTVDGETVSFWQGSHKYTKDIAKTSDGSAFARESGGYGGAILITKKGHTMVAFHVMAETEFFDQVLQETLEMVNSLKWVEATDEE